MTSQIYRKPKIAELYARHIDMPYALEMLEALQSCTIIRLVGKVEFAPSVLKLSVLVHKRPKIVLTKYLSNATLARKASAYAYYIMQFDLLVGITKKNGGATLYVPTFRILGKGGTEDIPF